MCEIPGYSQPRQALPNKKLTHDVLVGVRWDWIAISIEFLRAVLVEHVQANREELHNFSGKIFIREESNVIPLSVVRHAF